ncbi:O-antigen ligase family protein [Serinicoccus hydrothermalis]|uniref:O-antigen ligase family protein n=1 Tax=Serinicoccus hydrothermalis TaxID=1758689 RepID=UPI000830233A|nr:O-antigen ligase family protein [Serinicoccus hydrothermalis]
MTVATGHDLVGTAATLPRPWARSSRWLILLLVLSVVTWRTQTTYSGGVDAVVAAKALLGLMTLAFAWAARVSTRAPQPMGNAVVWLVVVYVALSTFGAWTDGGLRVSGVVSVRLLIVALTVVLLVKTFPRAQLLDDLLASLAAVALVAALTGLPSIWATGRLGGGIPQMHSNELSLLCALPVIGLLHRVILRRAAPGHVAVLLLLSAAMVATGSRTAVLTVMVAGAVMLVQARRLGRGLVVTLALTIPLLGLIATRTDAVTSFIAREGADEGDIATLNSRSIVWGASVDYADTVWTRWMGSGLAVKQIPVLGQYWDTQNLDSSWVSALVQAGLIGVVLLGVWVALTVLNSFRLAVEPRMLVQGLLAAILLRSVLESGLVDGSPAFLTFFLVSLFTTPAKVPRTGSPLRPSAGALTQPSARSMSRG